MQKILQKVNENIKSSNQVLNNLQILIQRLAKIMVTVNIVNIVTLIVLIMIMVVK